MTTREIIIKKTMSIAIAASALVVGMNSFANSVPLIKITGNWQLTVTVNIKNASGQEKPLTEVIIVDRPLAVEVKNERHEKLPEFNSNMPFEWLRGVIPEGIKAQECSAANALNPASVKVSATDGKTAYKIWKDFEFDLKWGSLGRTKNSRIKPDQSVFISYEYTPQRLDSVVLTHGNKIIIKKGIPHNANPAQPKLSEGEKRLLNIYLPGRMTKLDQDSLYTIMETAYPASQQNLSIAEKLLPKTMKALNGGRSLKILAWGDSVTDGSYLPDANNNRWQVQFVNRLRERYPNAKIELMTEAWGGHSSSSYLAEPAGSEHSYQKKVLAIKPDLVIMEFINDSWMDANTLQTQYTKLWNDINGIGAEWIIVAPHYMRPESMGLNGQKNIDEDPRPYVKFLKKFTAKNAIPLADVSSRYGRLWRQGIPYNTYMMNTINHPNPDGMKIFADSLMYLFQNK